jgi:hypothetical protein
VIGIEWVGWDGSRWDLREGREGVVLTQQSLAFIEQFETEDFTTTAAYVDGQRHEGWRGLPREFDVQVATIGDLGALGWAATEAAWKRTMRPGRPGTFIVSDPAGGTRTLTARAKSVVPNHANDPSDTTGTVLTYGMIADDPWWYGSTPAKFEFLGVQDPTPFFGRTGNGPPLYIETIAALGAATVTNNGDVDTWGIWTFHGPTPTFAARVAGRLIAGDFALQQGEFVTVDTRPFKKSATHSNGTNVTRQLRSRQYARIPAGEQVPVEVVVYGSSHATLEIREQFFGGYN